MSDMSQVIIPRSDQINADSLLSGPITITITKVDIKAGTEQPITIHYEGEDGKPWRPCKSMARCLVAAWGPDSKAYTGRSLTLFCDPKVKWGGLEVGGIRVSHMSHIDNAMTMALTVTRGNKKPYTVKPMSKQDLKNAAPQSHPVSGALPAADSAGAAPCITDDQCLELKMALVDGNVPEANFLKAAKVGYIEEIKADDFDKAKGWIAAAAAKRKAAQPPATPPAQSDGGIIGMKDDTL